MQTSRPTCFVLALTSRNPQQVSLVFTCKLTEEPQSTFYHGADRLYDHCRGKIRLEREMTDKADEMRAGKEEDVEVIKTTEPRRRKTVTRFSLHSCS